MFRTSSEFCELRTTDVTNIRTVTNISIPRYLRAVFSTVINKLGLGSDIVKAVCRSSRKLFVGIVWV
jgi:hypothetical protein